MIPFLMMMSTAQAGDILVPHFFPNGTTSQTEVQRFEDKVVEVLRELERDVVGPRTLAAEYPAFTDDCFRSPECPSRMLTRTNASLIMVASVDKVDGAYNVSIRYYNNTDRSPVNVFSRQGISSDDIDAVWVEAAQDASVLYDLVPKVVEKEKGGSDPQIIYVPQQEKKEKPKPKTLSDDVRLAKLPTKLQDDYLSSPLPLAEWFKMQRIRAGNVLVEIHLGVSFGDVVRRYDTRVGLTEDLDVFGVYEYDSWISGGPGVNMGGAIGFAPTWWLETSIYGGVVLYQKELTTGWSQYEDKDSLIDQDEVFYDPTTSAVGHIEPKIRLYMAPSGPVKPYIMTSCFIRIFDGYNPPNLPSVDYSPQPGGVHVGATGGIGLAFDSYSPVGVFIEIPYTQLLNATDYYRFDLHETTQDWSIADIPEQPNFTNNVIGFKVGMSLRFQ